MKGKNIYLENLKSINIQNANTELFSGFLYGFIYCLLRQRKTKITLFSQLMVTVCLYVIH